MAFNWKSFATGFMEKAVSEFEAEKAERKELFKIDYMDKLTQAREERDRRREEKKALEKAGNRLLGLGLDAGAASAVLKQEGAEGANALYELTVKAQAAGAKIDPKTFVSGAYDANLTITDAITQVMGELKPATPGAKPAAMQEESFFGKLFNMDSVDEKTARYYAKTFGEDYATISAEARGEYTTTPMEGGVKIDYAQLKVEDPDAELNRQIKEAQLAKINKELNDTDKFKSLTPSQLNTAKKEFAVLAGNKYGVELSYVDGEYVLPPQASDKHMLALADARTAMVRLDALNDKLGYANAYSSVADAMFPVPTGEEGDGSGGDTGDTGSATPTTTTVTLPDDVNTYINDITTTFKGMNEKNKKGAAVKILGNLRREYGITTRDDALKLLPPEIAKYLR